MPFWKVLFLPAAKVTNPDDLRGALTKFRLLTLAMFSAVLVFAFALARKDSSGSAVLQASDWLSRLPLTAATFLLNAAAWYLQVQVVDSTKLGKWAFHWDEKDPLEVKVAKTLAWGIYLGLSYLGTALIVSKLLGA